MPSEAEAPPPTPAAAQVVGSAIQDMAATRLGRGFLPLGLLFLVGLGQMLRGGGGFALAAGAPLAAGAMLAYGLRVVQRAFGRPARPWMILAVVGGLLPPVFGVYVLGWLGLRSVAEGGGLASFVGGVVMVGLGIWVLRAWMQIMELHRLAETMAMGFLKGEEEGE